MLKSIIKKINNSELLRNYILGFFNLCLNLIMLNQFQYNIFANVNIGIRTDLSVSTSFILGVTLSYFLTRWYVFRLKNIVGNFSMYLKFVSTNSLNFFIPIVVWFFIEFFISNYSSSFFNIVNFLIANILFPIKFIIYKYLIFESNE